MTNDPILTVQEKRESAERVKQERVVLLREYADCYGFHNNWNRILELNEAHKTITEYSRGYIDSLGFLRKVENASDRVKPGFSPRIVADILLDCLGK